MAESLLLLLLLLLLFLLLLLLLLLYYYYKYNKDLSPREVIFTVGKKNSDLFRRTAIT